MAPSAQGRQTVIVIGSGLAGLSAASAALRSSITDVVLLERAAKPGGNSIKASSGINGAPTRFQQQSSRDLAFFSDTVRSAGGRISQGEPNSARRKRLISLLTERSAAAVHFLADDIGVDLTVVAQLGGHTVPRTHRGAGKTPPGADIVSKLVAVLQKNNRFHLKTGCEVTKLLTRTSDTTTVVGVEYRFDNQLFSIAGPVVFATGGFAGDGDGMLARYRPDLASLPSTNEPRPGMHGLLTSAGAQVVDMDSVQVHPTGFVDPLAPNSHVKFLAAEMLRGEGGILLYKGKRFVNELGTREHVSSTIMGLEPSSGPSRQWDVQVLLDPGACVAAASHVAFYIWKGLLSRMKVSELDEATRETIREYSQAAAGKTSDVFGRVAFGHWVLAGGTEDNDKEVCVGWVTPVTHFTMGGVVINDKSEVMTSTLDANEETAIPGLWAAGEVTGGIHGDNRLGGSSLLECVVFGCIAGEQASAKAVVR
ncbi:hypothetical protein Sste5346_006808 [Sporothrix stenoceras]|uniref:Fumarate reductase n=1 Tax=Sporothrix stenoceras TaxID=5173 RepID=A0ABR3YWZ9_9PEZI